MSYEAILFEVQERIATVTLNRPERMNAWNQVMARELREAMVHCDEDDEIRAVVITGAGRAFCAGADLGGGGPARRAERSAEPDPEREAELARTRELARRYDGFAGPFPWQIRKPVFAAINGHAVGVGITYPMTCDVRFVAEDAKIQFAFVRRGLIPELWAHQIVAHVAGLSNAADLLLTGRQISGREFAQLGLATAALPAGEVLAATRERAREVLKAAPVSVAITKRLLWHGLGASFATIGRAEARLFNWTTQQADSREGVASFVQKRDPEWKLSVAKDTPDIPAKD
jgi:enoyl-CoA hydratase/carnithine racemase